MARHIRAAGKTRATLGCGSDEAGLQRVRTEQRRIEPGRFQVPLRTYPARR